MTRSLLAYDGSPAARDAAERVVALHHDGDAVGIVRVSHAPVGGTHVKRSRNVHGSRRLVLGSVSAGVVTTPAAT